jgi:hypothetical protein
MADLVIMGCQGGFHGVPEVAYQGKEVDLGGFFWAYLRVLAEVNRQLQVLARILERVEVVHCRRFLTPQDGAEDGVLKSMMEATGDGDLSSLAPSI